MIKEINGTRPEIDRTCFIADNAMIVGDVKMQSNTSLWYGACIRSDMDKTIIGRNTNIQDNSTIHNDFGSPTIIGNEVTIGHNCVIHGCTINDNVLIGMGTVILNGAQVGKNTIIGAGSLITQNKVIPEGVLCMGSPAKVIRKLTKEEITSIKESSVHYIDMANMHR